MPDMMVAQQSAVRQAMIAQDMHDSATSSGDSSGGGGGTEGPLAMVIPGLASMFPGLLTTPVWQVITMGLQKWDQLIPKSGAGFQMSHGGLSSQRQKQAKGMIGL